MYDTEQNEQNRRREQSLYRAAFAGVHASESLKREDFYMKHNKPGKGAGRTSGVHLHAACSTFVHDVDDGLRGD